MRSTPYGFVRAFDGLQLRYGHWPCQSGVGRGTVIVLGGRTEFIEKYLESIADLNQRGFDVFSLDWRGQGLSGRMLTNPQKGYVEDYAHYVADLNQFMDEVVLPLCPRPLIVLAHSMGATIALLYLSRYPGIFDKVILTAPLINIHVGGVAERVGRQLSRWAVQKGMGGLGIPPVRRKNSFNGPFRNNGLTSDPQRFYRIRQFIRDNRQLSVSQVTFGWLKATYEAIDSIHRDGFARGITVPVLCLIAGRDTVVCNHATRRYASKLPVHRVETIAGACHELLQETDRIRLQCWRAFDEFVSG